ncbi:MAG: GAF domain-containing protein [Acidobacteria bacterium]|nr:GAF domain-containing protein [Acidobacteriota bacterium]
MRPRVGLRTFGALLALPVVAVLGGSLRTAAGGRAAFEELTATLGALGETTRLEERIQRGVAAQLAAAAEYLRGGSHRSWDEFTALAWSVYEDEARYLSLPLTGEERLAVERVRTQHRIFEGMAQDAMARRGGGPAPGDLPTIRAAYSRVEESIDEVSRMIQARLATAAASAGHASERMGFAMAALSALFVLALALSSWLALRGVLGPLEALQAAAARLERGDLGARAPVSGLPAVAQLGERFNSMAAELEGLLQRLEERVEARTAQLVALESLSRAGLTHLDRDALLRMVVERMAAVAGTEAANLRLVRDGRLVCLASRGSADEEPLGLDRQPTARALESRRALWVENLAGDPESAALVGRGFRGAVLVPLVVENRGAGVVGLFFHDARPRDPDLVRVLEAMAARAALALERAEMVDALLRNAEALEAANRKLLQTQERLVEAERLAAVGQVHVTLRHEINNPLSVLVGAAEILEHRADDPEVVRHWARQLGEAAARISRVLRRLEELRRVETTDYAAGVSMVDLGKPERDP